MRILPLLLGTKGYFSVWLLLLATFHSFDKFNKKIWGVSSPLIQMDITNHCASKEQLGH